MGMECHTIEALQAASVSSNVADQRVIAGVIVAIGILALAHAAVTWPLFATVAFFLGGAIVAFVAEVIAIYRGWLEHHIGPKLVGVPLYILFGWTGLVYIAFRVALLVTDGWIAVATAGVIATSYDLLVDHRGVEDGSWTYSDDFPGPRYRGVPWLNFVGWLVISCITAALATPFL